MSRTFIVYCTVTVATLIGHYALNSQRQITNLQMLVEVSHQKENIQNDQIVELIASLQQANQRNDALKTEGYVAGISDAINKPDHYLAIWHQGYDRGSMVQKDIMSLSSKNQVDSAAKSE